MRFSRPFKSSAQSLPSPDGQHIAHLFPTNLTIRATRSLEIIRVISLPAEFVSSATWFLWSASSKRLLLASTNELRLFSVARDQAIASITNLRSQPAKVTSILFGAGDNEVCMFSDFGLKLTIYDFATSKSTHIPNPKFHTPGTSAKGISHRPGTHNLSILTRNSGKDIISIHAPSSLEIERSWYPDTVDAQGLAWSPDGRWIAVWDSASQCHKMLLYTADGHLYKTWNGPMPTSEDAVDSTLGAGVKIYCWSPTGSQIAVGDYSNRVTILSAPSFMESMSLLHSTTIRPADSLQVWQEQAVPSENGFSKEFIPVAQTISPPTSESPAGDSSIKLGTNILSFDSSGTLLATRAESMPTTLWIWDVGTKIIRTVLMLHAPIARAAWHPTINELLLIRCEGEENRGLVHLWDPSWGAPKIIDFASQIPGGQLLGKTIGRWLNAESSSPAIFFSDTQDCMLASISESGDGELPWEYSEALAFDIYGRREESPLNLVPADGKMHNSKTSLDFMNDEDIGVGVNGSDEVEDTFRFRKFVEPS